MPKRKRLTEDDVVNWWLEKYHSTTLEEVMEEHPEYNKDSRLFYKEYQVTEQQHDEWKAWLVKSLMKESGMGKKYTESHMWVIYLNIAPLIHKKH